MRFTDGKRTVEIRMSFQNGNEYTLDFSTDFFEAGSLKYDKEKDAYFVKDVDYCIAYAKDWKNTEGDFIDDEPNENNTVLVNEIDQYIEGADHILTKEDSQMDAGIMKYIPKDKQDAVRDAYKDSDGYWICLKEG